MRSSVGLHGAVVQIGCQMPRNSHSVRYEGPVCTKVVVAGTATERIGESLFTLFASLTYAYHYLMTLIKLKL